MDREMGLGSDFVSPLPLWTRLATHQISTSEHGAKLFQASPETFVNWRWQMKHQIQSRDELLGILQLDQSEISGFEKLNSKFQSGITPYYAALMDPLDPDCAIRKQAIPRIQELSDSFGVADPLEEEKNSPIKEVVHVYKNRVAFCVAQLCSVYCRYCFRKRRDGEDGLHFNPRIVDGGIAYIRSNSDITDVLLTGGDPLVAHDHQILDVVRRLREIKHVDIIRIGTRVPVTLPYRITTALAEGLAKYHPIWINTHFNHSKELTPEAAGAIDILLRQGIPVGNQSVLLRGINDSFEEMKALLEGLVRMRVRPYYLYHPQNVEGTEHLRVPIELGLDLMKRLRGKVTGFALPQYVLDTPTGKIPISPQFLLGREGEFVVFEDLKGGKWSEHNPLNPKVTFAP